MAEPVGLPVYFSFSSTYIAGIRGRAPKTTLAPTWLGESDVHRNIGSICKRCWCGNVGCRGYSVCRREGALNQEEET